MIRACARTGCKQMKLFDINAVTPYGADFNFFFLQVVVGCVCITPLLVVFFFFFFRGGKGKYVGPLWLVLIFSF